MEDRGSEFLEYLKPCVTGEEVREVISYLLTRELGDAESDQARVEAEEMIQALRDRVQLHKEVKDFKAKTFLWQLKKKSGN